MPPALLDFSAGVLRERFGSGIRKPIFTFSFERYDEVLIISFNIDVFLLFSNRSMAQVTPQLLAKLRLARYLRAVVVSTPPAIKSFMLKFIEICHNLNRLCDQENEQIEAGKVNRSTLSSLIKIATSRLALSRGRLSADDVRFLRDQGLICLEIFDLLHESVEIMDEVDMILHPLKSELNWPLGEKQPLDFTLNSSGNGLRWQIPGHLLDAVFTCCGMPVLADMADSKAASE